MANILQCQTAKKSKWLYAKIIITQSWYNSIERFFQFYTLLFLVRGAILTGLFLFNFKQLNARIILTYSVKINLAVTEIFSFSCSALFLVMESGRHLGMPNCKNSKWVHTRNILAQSWINFNK